MLGNDRQNIGRSDNRLTRRNVDYFTLNMPLTHRPIEEKDIQLICGFPQNEDELFFLFPKAAFPLTPPQLQDAIAHRSDSTVVELGGEVVAFANFYRWEVGGCCAIGNVIVSPAARRRGVGRYLIEQMIALAFSKHHATEATVSCFNQNVAGLLLYPKLGFQPYAVEERKNKKGNRVALIHMHLPRNAATRSGREGRSASGLHLLATHPSP